jgi:SAM-dependent methyltransferase
LKERPVEPRHLAEIDRAVAAIEPPEEMRSWFEGYAAGHRLRFANDLRLLEDFGGMTQSVLEFGCVPPVLTGALVHRGLDVTGVDIAPERFERSLAALGCPIVKCNIETEPLPFDDASFDLVLFNEIFEHLRVDLLFTFSELCRVLKPGALLMLSTPNLRSFRGMLGLVVKGRSAWCCPNIYEEWGKISRLGHMGHVREYTTRDVTSFLGAVGFEIDFVVHRGKAEGAVEGTLCALLPQLLPFITVVARRTSDASSDGR